MNFSIITDTSANLPTSLLKKEGITAIPFSYFIDGEEFTCKHTAAFRCKSYYESLKKGVKVTTSQITPQKYIDWMEPVLKAGQDILFIGMSSGISGSFASAELAAEELRQQYPDRAICLVDSLGASLGEGLMVLKAIKCKKIGMTLVETAEHLTAYRQRIYQVFTVDDLMYLRRGGRLSNASALVGSLLGIKPLLKGSEAGKIVSFDKIRGRQAVIEQMAKKYDTLAVAGGAQFVGISHGNCRADAEYLAKLLKRNHPPRDIMIVEHEPVTGSYLGPGALALFFEGGEDVREK